jgi:hypothetical protein
MENDDKRLIEALILKTGTLKAAALAALQLLENPDAEPEDADAVMDQLRRVLDLGRPG